MDLLLLSAADDAAAVLPPLGLLAHGVEVVATLAAAPEQAMRADVIVVDALTDLPRARAASASLAAAVPGVPVLVVVTEGDAIALNAEWGLADFVLSSAGPAEVDARLRLLGAHAARGGGSREPDGAAASTVTLGELVIDEDTYTARLRGRPVDLTYKEFELLKFLCHSPGRVYTRAQLLHEVWGYDYFGGTRTVDVHVRRLRAKLGSEYESMIGTVRNVGYKSVPQPGSREPGD
ncbi:winged helix-turn-helix domain-containing protein [Tomitella gaofuii]|uniref:winged helix-turn-helix domain-containing protein n=1 Tax=Tomitella gaofuii TaxID=2760083 RepID=UPI0015F923E2|nr:response regulator transcription factor [Tomitella gaofuii]